VAKVYEFRRREADAGAPTSLKNTQKRSAEVTGVSERSVAIIVREKKTTESGASNSLRLHTKRDFYHLN
jgi:hypothetical protein